MKLAVYIKNEDEQINRTKKYIKSLDKKPYQKNYIDKEKGFDLVLFEQLKKDIDKFDVLLIDNISWLGVTSDQIIDRVIDLKKRIEIRCTDVKCSLIFDNKNPMSNSMLAFIADLLIYEKKSFSR